MPSSETMLNGTLLEAYFKYTNLSQEKIMSFIWSSLHIQSAIPMEVTISLFFAIFLFSLIGNTIVVLLAVKVKNMRTRINFLLANLSLGSLGVTTFCMPFFAAEQLIASKWIFGGFWCKGLHTLENVFTIVCILTVAAISYDRYLGICSPMNLYTRWRATSMKIIIPSMWGIAIVSSIPTVFCVKETILEMSKYQVAMCSIETDLTLRKLYHGILSSLYSTLFLFSVYLITRMVISLCKGKNKKKKVIIVLLLMAATFFIFLLPYRVLMVFFTFFPHETSDILGYRNCFVLYESFRLGAFVNFALNPIIYNFSSSKFKNAFKQLFLKQGLQKINSLVRQKRKARESFSLNSKSKKKDVVRETSL